LILYRARRYAEALAACDEATRLQPADPAVYRVRGEALLQQGQHRQAAAALSIFLSKGKPDADAYRQRALARSALGDRAGAIEDYARALALRPNDVGLLAARGWAYLVSDAPRLALGDFEAVLKQAPNEADAYNGRGLARAQLGQGRAALADAQEALRRGTRSPRLLYNAARIYATVGAVPRNPAHQQRALELLRGAGELLPAGARAGFWRETVMKDSAFVSLHRSAELLRLARPSSPPR